MACTYKNVFLFMLVPVDEVSRYPKYTAWAKKIQRTPKPTQDPLAPEIPNAAAAAGGGGGAGGGGNSSQALVAAIKNKNKVRGCFEGARAT